MPSRVILPIDQTGQPTVDFPDNMSIGAASSTDYVIHTDASGVIDPSLTYGAHGRYRVEALGNNTFFESIPANGIERVGFPIEGSDQRFGFVVDPNNAAKRAAVMRLDSTDPLTASATRIEMSCLGTTCAENNEYTIGFAFRTGMWKQSDDEQVIFQMKSVATGPGNPFLALVVGGGGRGAAWNIRYNASPDPQQVGNTVLPIISVPWVEQEWEYYVIQLKRHWDLAQLPSLKIWRNGTQVIDYAGPISYNIPNDVSQIKLGIYHYTPPAWVAPLNRVAYFKGLLQYPGFVNETVVRSILQAI